MIKTDEVYKIGRIGKPHGVKGELSFMFDDDVFDTADSDYLVLLVDGILVPFFLEEYRFKSDDTALLKFDGIDTKEQARELTGCDVYFPVSMAAGAGENPSLHSVVGFTVIDAACGDKLIGTITSVDESTENLLFNVETPDGRDIMLPVADEFIVDVNTEERQIRMKLPEGLVEINN